MRTMALAMVLIETSWNVKGYPDDKKTKFVGVLIETSWNVKNRRRTTADKITSVLIETSWNVKDAVKKLSGMSHLY